MISPQNLARGIIKAVGNTLKRKRTRDPRTVRIRVERLLGPLIPEKDSESKKAKSSYIHIGCHFENSDWLSNGNETRLF